MLPVELPTFEATWWPLRMETIPGSDEAITVAIMVRAASGQAQVRQCVQPAAFGGMFGADTGRGVSGMVTSCVLTIQQQLDAGIFTDALELPFGGFEFGRSRDCVARDMNEVFDVAVRLSAAFGESAFGRQVEVTDSSKAAFDDWADRVRLALLTDGSPLALDGHEFNVPVKLTKKRVRFGLLLRSYAANFGVLRPGSTSGDIRSLKVKVFDLEALRRDQILPVEHTDVLVGCPQHAGMSAFSSRERESYFASLEFIETEARARNVALVRCAEPADAARHIRAMLAAA